MSEDLIKREDAIKAIKQWRDNDGSLFDVGLNQAIREIKRLPSADRPQGEWINKHEWANGFYERECSICGAMKPILMHTAKVNFCPTCGADMRGDNDGKDIQSADE